MQDFKANSVYIAFEAFPRAKGASSHIASMIQALAKSTGNTLLICLGFGEMPSHQQEGNIYIRRFKEYHPNMLVRAENFANFVIETLHEYRESVKLCVFRDIWGGFPALVSGIEAKFLFEVNALSSWELEYTYPSFTKNHTLKAKIQDMERKCLISTDKILTVSPVTKKALENEGIDGEKITVIPNSAHEAFFCDNYDSDQLIESLKNNKWIGYFGSLHHWQGIDLAVDAFKLIADDIPDYNLMIITGGKKLTRKALRKKIRKSGLTERIFIHPALPAEQLAVNVNHFDFTLAPLRDTPRNTKQGCCPVKIIESMATGTPVIAANLKCVTDLVKNNETGILVKPDCIRSLANAMFNLINDSKKRENISKKAQIFAFKHFNRDNIHNMLSTVFMETINTGGNDGK